MAVIGDIVGRQRLWTTLLLAKPKQQTICVLPAIWVLCKGLLVAFQKQHEWWWRFVKLHGYKHLHLPVPQLGWHPNNGLSEQHHDRLFNTMRLRQNGCNFADNTFKHILLNENVKISTTISLNFVPKGPFNNTPALVQIMAWSWSGKMPLSEPMVVSLLMRICVTPPQWVNCIISISSCLLLSCADSQTLG